MGRGSNIPWVGGSKYHGKGVGYTMGREFDTPCMGVQYTMSREFKIPWVGGSIYHG
jgi:hypothetical protein